MRAGWAKPQLQKPLWLLLLQHYKHYIHHTLSIKGFLWKRRPTKIFLYKTLTSITIVQLYMRREKSDQPASWPLNYQKINISCSAKRPPISRKCWRPQLPQSKLGAAISWLAFEFMLSPRSSCDLWRQNWNASSLVKGSKGNAMHINDPLQRTVKFAQRKSWSSTCSFG